MPYKEPWKRSEAVRRFRRRQRAQRQRASEHRRPLPTSQTVTSSPGNSPLQAHGSTAWLLWGGISALTVLAAITGRKPA